MRHLIALLIAAPLMITAAPIAAADQTAIPRAFIGTWGAPSAPCADVDAVDRVIITSDSLSYYEMTDTVTRVDIRDARHIVVQVEASDDGGGRGEAATRHLSLSSDGNGLTISGFPNSYQSKLGRCHR